MRRFAHLTALLLSLPLVAACGANETTVAPAPSEIILARPLGPTGPLAGFDARSTERRFELRDAVAAADGSALYAMRDGAVEVFDPGSGERKGRISAPGGWDLAAVSADGTHIALVRGGTQVRVLETNTGEALHDVSLPQDFEVETVSPDGNFLFLIQHFPDGAYSVRGYDLVAGQLLKGSLGTKGQTVKMIGQAAGTAASTDGRWLLTLYVDSNRRKAFVHALNVEGRYPLCIDLPSGAGDLAKLAQYALSVSPDGRTAFAANPALGRVVEVHLLSARPVWTGGFKAAPGRGSRSVLSRDGSRLFFTNGSSVWSYETATGVIREAHRSSEPVRDLALSRDGKTLYLTPAGGTPTPISV